jgi:hypothetical protein
VVARDEVGELIRDLGHIPRDAQRWVRPAIQRAGSDILQEARSNAFWSRRIPPATRLSVRFSRNPGVDVITDAARAPHAPYYENQGRPGRFRHPLFGDRNHWYSQRARPFLGPAMDAKSDEAVAQIADAVDRALFNAQFR